jgi:hypothetical protein
VLFVQHVCGLHGSLVSPSASDGHNALVACTCDGANLSSHSTVADHPTLSKRQAKPCMIAKKRRISVSNIAPQTINLPCQTMTKTHESHRMGHPRNFQSAELPPSTLISWLCRSSSSSMILRHMIWNDAECRYHNCMGNLCEAKSSTPLYLTQYHLILQVFIQLPNQR